MKMTDKQIDELNDLLVDHSEAITAFYDETIYRVKLRIGHEIGVIAPIVIVCSGLVGRWFTKSLKKNED